MSLSVRKRQRNNIRGEEKKRLGGAKKRKIDRQKSNFYHLMGSLLASADYSPKQEGTTNIAANI